MSSIAEAYATLNKCRTVAKDKGDAGEEILMALAKEYQEDYPCVILWSYSYPYSSNRNGQLYTGNIKLQNGEFIELTKEGYNDEIDLVIVTNYRVFVIECKARSGTWVLYDHWAKQNSVDVDKSPISQCEKHARHLYPLIYEYLPDGKPEYIVPLTVFVDKCKLTDKRGAFDRKYIKATIANKFKSVLQANDTPLEYQIDIKHLVDFMLQKGTVRKLCK